MVNYGVCEIGTLINNNCMYYDVLVQGIFGEYCCYEQIFYA